MLSNAQFLQIVSLALISTNPLYVYACDLIMSLDDLLVFINSQWGIVLPLVQMFHSVIGSVGPIQGRNCKRVCLFTLRYLWLFLNVMPRHLLPVFDVPIIIGGVGSLSYATFLCLASSIWYSHLLFFFFFILFRLWKCCTRTTFRLSMFDFFFFYIIDIFPIDLFFYQSKNIYNTELLKGGCSRICYR